MFAQALAVVVQVAVSTSLLAVHRVPTRRQARCRLQPVVPALEDRCISMADMAVALLEVALRS